MTKYLIVGTVQAARFWRDEHPEVPRLDVVSLVDGQRVLRGVKEPIKVIFEHQQSLGPHWSPLFDSALENAYASNASLGLTPYGEEQ